MDWFRPILKGRSTLHKAFSVVLSVFLVVVLLPIGAYAQDSNDDTTSSVSSEESTTVDAAEESATTDAAEDSSEVFVVASWVIDADEAEDEVDVKDEAKIKIRATDEAENEAENEANDEATDEAEDENGTESESENESESESVVATLYSDGLLEITGSGETETYDWDDSAPWYSDGYADDILSVSFREDVTLTSLAFWFYGCSNLTKVLNLPDTVTDMAYTFGSCWSLVEVPDIPDSVTDLGNTFFDCISLVEAPKLPEGITDLNYTFMYCESLVETPEIPDSVIAMYGTFEGCSSLRIVSEIPDSVMILNSTFAYCTSLEKLPEIPDSVTDLDFAFYLCTSLVEAPEIPSSVTSLNYTFYGCSSLVETPVIPDTVVSMFATFEGCALLVEAPLIPDSVVYMYRTFYNCTSLTVLPDGFSFPEGVEDTTEAFGFDDTYSSNNLLTTYCSADDYEALAAAYKWESSGRELAVRDDSEGPVLTYNGYNRYETAALIVSQEILTAAEYLGTTFSGVIVANGDDEHFADALAASGLSGLLDYPIVLTTGDDLSIYARSVIYRIAAAAEGDLNIIVLGDENAISEEVREQLDAYGDLVELQGENRYETAQAIYDYGAEVANWNTEYTIIATGENFPDALSIASYAAYANARVVLVNGKLDSLTESTAAEIADSENIIILGDSNAVSSGIESELISIFGADHVTRLAGANRYETSVEVAAWALSQGMTLDGAGFATGECPADALVSSTLLGMAGSVLLLMNPNDSNTAALDLVAAYAEGVSTINIFGDENSVSAEIRASITSALGW